MTIRTICGIGATIVGALALSGCEEGEKPVARVGGAVITREQLERTVEHFREEARREGKDFPDDDQPGFRAARSQLLGLLVYRTELALAAKRLGVGVADEDVEARLRANASGEESGGEEEAFARDSVRSQLELEGIARTINRGVTDAAARNEKLRAFLARMRERYGSRISYEPGYAPGS